MSGKSNVINAAASVFVCALMSSSAIAQNCAADLDRIEQTLDGSELSSEERQPLGAELDGARQLADSGDEQGCSAAAAKLQAAMLQVEGVDQDALCGRAKSEEDIGEADMSGNQDVLSALQTSCDE